MFPDQFLEDSMEGISTWNVVVSLDAKVQSSVHEQADASVGHWFGRDSSNHHPSWIIAKMMALFRGTAGSVSVNQM